MNRFCVVSVMVHIAVIGQFAALAAGDEATTELSSNVQELLIPAAVSTPGAYGTNWESDFRFFNPCAEGVEVTLEFQPEDTQNVGATLETSSFQLASRETMIFGDIFEAFPSLIQQEVSGSIRVMSSIPSGCAVTVVSRTFNATPEGTLGLMVPAMRVDSSTHASLDFPGLAHGDGYRSNLRLVNFSDTTAWVSVTAFDDEGVSIGEPRSAQVYGRSTKQINNVASWLNAGNQPPPFTVRVATDDRPLQAIATVVDNITGDSVLYTSSFDDSTTMWLPGVASLSGLNESQWRTDLCLYNSTGSQLAGESEFFVGDDPSQSVPIEWSPLDARYSLWYPDLVSDELGLEETRGYVVLTGDDGSPVPQIAARTYNLDPEAGTFGLNLLAYGDEDLIHPGEEAYIAGVSNSSDGSVGFRTNLGMLNTSHNRWVTVAVRLYDLDGSLFATPYETNIGPGVMRQFNVFDVFGLGDVDVVGSIAVAVLKGDGVAVYASEIDNRTQDSIFIPGQRAVYADGCRFILEPAQGHFDETGGSRSFKVTTGPDCEWEAHASPSASSWVSVTPKLEGHVGSSTVHYGVLPNSEDSRTATISVGRSSFRVSQEAPSNEVTVTLPGDVTLDLVFISPGSYEMGSPSTERGREQNETLHDVTLTQGYYIGKYEITQSQWVALMDENPVSGAGAGNDYPVASVSWDQIAGPDGFIDRLNDHLESTGQVGAGAFRLPTEAEWEMAARAGTQTRFSFGDGLECPDDQCDSCGLFDQNMWWCGNTGSHPEPTGRKAANPFGVFDMHGNVAEWVNDHWQEDLGTAPRTNPTGPDEGGQHAIRGGSCTDQPRLVRAAARHGRAPDLSDGSTGFRIMRSLAPPARITTCGQTVVTDAYFDDDLVCVADELGEVAVHVGASDVTVDLGGNTLSGHPLYGIAFTVWDVDGVTIRNGSIQDFKWGSDVLSGRDITFEDLSISNIESDHPRDDIIGIQTFRTENLIVKNATFEFLPVTHKSGIGTYGTSYTIDSIESIGGASAITLSCIPCCPFEGNSGTITNSRIEGATIGAILVYCTSDTTITGNEFIDNEVGIIAQAVVEDSVTGMLVSDNTMTGGFRGVLSWAGSDSIYRDNVIHGMYTGVFLDADIGCPNPPDANCYYSTGNLVTGNEVTGNAIDLSHHPNALGNTWSDNICETWEGSEIPGCIAP